MTAKLYIYSILIGSLFIGQSAFAQENMSQMEKLLNQVDQSGNWNQPAYTAPVQPTEQQMQPVFSRQNIMQAVLGGSPAASTSPSNDTTSGGFGKAQNYIEQDLNKARYERNKAEADCDRASHGSDRESRMSAAESARYSAQTAREAAEKAESAAYNTNDYLTGLAASARDAANKAQEAADRATYNAETYKSGW